MQRTGLKCTSLARPLAPMMEMAWSMPPLSVPTYFSHAAVNAATSYAAPGAKSGQGPCDNAAQRHTLLGHATACNCMHGIGLCSQREQEQTCMSLLC